MRPSQLDHPSEHIVQVGLILDAEVRGTNFLEALLQIEGYGMTIFRVGCQPDRWTADITRISQPLLQEQPSKTPTMMAGLHIKGGYFHGRTVRDGFRLSVANANESIKAVFVL
ncbi:hypothetical protein C8J36_1105 [Rhizobium sp. PP-F2F-G48]|nr:hypothetical protein C8J36_1105 [Rhizobium sp. PP-F2F-G48]